LPQEKDIKLEVKLEAKAICKTEETWIKKRTSLKMGGHGMLAHQGRPEFKTAMSAKPINH
jgi:hypothetical protein